MQKKKIAVIFGGNSTEYEVSLQSASAVFENINSPTNSIADYLHHSSDDDCSDTVIFQIASSTKFVCREQHRTLFYGLLDISCVQRGINGNVE